MAPQPKLTVVDKVPNIPFVLLGLTQWIHKREATVLRHAMTAMAKVIYTSRISSIYNIHGRTGSDWDRTGFGLGLGLGVELEVGWGVNGQRDHFCASSGQCCWIYSEPEVMIGELYSLVVI